MCVFLALDQSELPLAVLFGADEGRVHEDLAEKVRALLVQVGLREARSEGRKLGLVVPERD